MATLIISAGGTLNTFNSPLAQAVSNSEPIQTGVFRSTIDDSEDDDEFGTQEAEPQLREPVGLSDQNTTPAARAGARGPVIYGAADNESARSNVAAAPNQTGNDSTYEEEPFAPTGFRLGTFNGSASLEQAIGHSSNLRGAPDGNSGAFTQTDVALGLISDWSRHQLRSSLTGSYLKPFDKNELEEPNLYADVALRLDLADGYTATSTAYYNYATQSFTSDTIVPGAIDTPAIETYGGNLELQRADRKLQLTLRGSLDRTVYGDADLGGGVVQSQSDQNNNLYQLTARAGYETSPAFTPFIEGTLGWQVHDEAIDRNGNRRDSEIVELRGGVEIDLGEKLTGEFSAGYVTEEFDDPLLASLEGVTLDAELEWSPERDTIIRFIAGTDLNGSISANENGSLIYNAGVEFERQINSRLGINGFATYTYNDNIDQDTTWEFGIGGEYWLNRHMAITSDLEYLVFENNIPADGFDELSARMGILLQR